MAAAEPDTKRTAPRHIARVYVFNGVITAPRPKDPAVLEALGGPPELTLASSSAAAADPYAELCELYSATGRSMSEFEFRFFVDGPLTLDAEPVLALAEHGAVTWRLPRKSVDGASGAVRLSDKIRLIYAAR